VPPAAAEATNPSPGSPSGEEGEVEVGAEVNGGRSPSAGPPRPAIPPPPPPAQPLPLLVYWGEESGLWLEDGGEEN